MKEVNLLNNIKCADEMNSIKNFISHEIRISATGIMGVSYLLTKNKLTREEKEFVDLLNNSVKRLLYLADFLNH
jgi:signal transduction histidine kinase